MPGPARIPKSQMQKGKVHLDQRQRTLKLLEALNTTPA